MEATGPAQEARGCGNQGREESGGNGSVIGKVEKLGRRRVYKRQMQENMDPKCSICGVWAPLKKRKKKENMDDSQLKEGIDSPQGSLDRKQAIDVTDRRGRLTWQKDVTDMDKRDRQT